VKFFVIFAIFTALDAFAYGVTRYPERTSSWAYKVPGGGFIALLRYGRTRQ
jgi:hypothetical protein